MAGFSPVYREIPFLSPLDLFRRLRTKNSILFDSVRGSGHTAAFSFVCIEPYLSFRAKDGLIEIECCGKKTVSSREPVERLRELLSSCRMNTVWGLPPFQGGAAGMLGYDFVRYIERLPDSAADDLMMPDAHLFLFDRVISLDHLRKKAWIIVCPGVRETVLGYTDVSPSDGHIRRAEVELARLYDLATLPDHCSIKPPIPEASCSKISVGHETDKETYMDMVRRAKEYIAAGDIFQCNLSLRISAEIGGRDPLAIYEALRGVNPSPFASFADFGDYQLVGSSPERLVRVRDGCVDTRPIAGTRPRGRTETEDEDMRSELLLNDKERAEHIMLIDLERNDLGRVCDYGTVEVNELMVTEDYSHVIHIVSNVRGRLTKGRDCFDVIKAVFPGGTITGVPKVRCMEIIDEIEPVRRGHYTGSLGYIGFDGSMDLNIIIRTMLIKEGRAYIQAGAGIVADSDPEREYYECLKKAEALVRTLESV